MSKTAIVIIIVLSVILLLLGVAAFLTFGYQTPYMQAENSMPKDGALTLYRQEDGNVRLVWPEGINVTRYLVEILDPAAPAPAEGEEPAPALYSAYVEGTNEHVLTELTEDAERTIRVSSVCEYQFVIGNKIHLRPGNTALQTTGLFTSPEVGNLSWEPDPDADTVTVFFEMPENGTCCLYYTEADGSLTEVMQVDEGTAVLEFGAGKMLSLPERGTPDTFSLAVYAAYPGSTYYGLVCDSFSVDREDLLGRDLNLMQFQDRENQFRFTWSETKGDYYILQIYDLETESWHEMERVGQNDAFSCSSGRLEPFTSYRFRVVAVGGQTMPDSEFAAVSEELDVVTESSLLYSTIWPIKDLDVYADADKKTKIGSIKKGTPFCVLGEDNNMFQIGMRDGYGYIESQFCLINLPDFIGDLCYYNITNSYESLFKAHEYDLLDITGKPVEGYEDVRLGYDSYLVPLLYPTALKLIDAAKDARENGYVLKIYDAFRPRKATSKLYDMTMDLADTPLPDQPGADTYVPGTEVPPEVVTFGEYMTDNGRYQMSAFLAGGYSQHNRGVALDLTLVKLSNGQELEMQTPIHDLSWFSELDQNKTNARTLYNIMHRNGFGGLASEWWHFQDNAAIRAYTLPYLWSGVSLRGWVVDDYGWRYRTSGGKYYTDCTKTIDGVEYSFDSYGYLAGEIAE